MLFCFLVLPMFRLCNHKEVRTVPMSPPAGHVWLHPTHLDVHEGLHEAALRHQRNHVQRLCVFVFLHVLQLVSDVARNEDSTNPHCFGQHQKQIIFYFKCVKNTAEYEQMDTNICLCLSIWSPYT